MHAWKTMICPSEALTRQRSTKLAWLFVLLTLATVAAPVSRAVEVSPDIFGRQSTKPNCQITCETGYLWSSHRLLKILRPLALQFATDHWRTAQTSCDRPTGCRVDGIELESLMLLQGRLNLDSNSLKEGARGSEINAPQVESKLLRMRRLMQSGSSSTGTDTTTDRSGTMFPRPKTQWKRAWTLQKDGVGRPGFVTRNSTASARSTKEP